MLIHKHLFFLALLSAQSIAAMQNNKTNNKEEKERVDSVLKLANLAVERSNQSLLLTHSALQTCTDAYKKATNALNSTHEIHKSLDQALAKQKELQDLTEIAKAGLLDEFNRIIDEAEKNENNRSLEERIQIEQAKIQAKKDFGIFDQQEKIRAQASVNTGVETESVKWKNIREILNDSKPMIKIVLAIAILTLCVYTIKYSIPALMNYLTQPHVISETSKTGWFDWWQSKPNIDINHLIFTPMLQQQLSELLSRVECANRYNENLPNILFHGAPGTGKTAFIRLLAKLSGLDYAFTSGSEFAKITDLNIANNELRKLLAWAKNSSKGLIVFIDEAESLFANRKLPTTSKNAQDFINTFLALVSEQSQKNVMFIFATNHPFKLDDAITNRIGINIEFTLPEAPEREKILALYLVQFAQENKDAIVNVHPVMSWLRTYADNLEGFSPRAIKFVAEEMIVKARRQPSKLLTNDIAQAALDEAKRSLQQTTAWEGERDLWLNAALALGR